MAYRVVYGSLGEEKRGKSTRRRVRALWPIGLVLFLVVLAGLIHGGVLPWVRDVLLPGDSAVTAAALENMVRALLEGASVPDAVTAFCQEILANAGP